MCACRNTLSIDRPRRGAERTRAADYLRAEPNDAWERGCGVRSCQSPYVFEITTVLVATIFSRPISAGYATRITVILILCSVIAGRRDGGLDRRSRGDFWAKLKFFEPEVWLTLSIRV